MLLRQEVGVEGTFGDLIVSTKGVLGFKLSIVAEGFKLLLLELVLVPLEIINESLCVGGHVDLGQRHHIIGAVAVSLEHLLDSLRHV